MTLDKIIAFFIGAVFLAMVFLVAFSGTSEGGNPNTILLTEKNLVTLNLPISEDTAGAIQQDLMDRDAKLPSGKPIYLFLNSPGGSVNDGQAIIETAKGLGRPVHTITSFSASMSFIISQALGDRYVLAHSTMMAHKAHVEGVGGDLPGSLISRTNWLLRGILELDTVAANRAGLSLIDYNKLTANELWMTGYDAVLNKFADKVVQVKCDSSLQGEGASQKFGMGIFSVWIKFQKCPLVTAPTLQGGDESLFRMLAGPKERLTRTIQEQF